MQLDRIRIYPSCAYNKGEEANWKITRKPLYLDQAIS